MNHVGSASSVAGTSVDEPAPQRGIPVAPARVARTETVKPTRHECRPSSKYGAFGQEYDQWSSSHPELFESNFPNTGSRIEMNTKWGPLGDEFWEFRIKAAACRVRVAAFAAKPGNSARLTEDERLQILMTVFDESCASRFADADMLFECIDRRAANIISLLKAKPIEPERLPGGGHRGGRFETARRLCENLDWDRQLAGHSPGSGLRRGVDPGIPQARDVLSTFNALGLDAHSTVTGRLYQGCLSAYLE